MNNWKPIENAPKDGTVILIAGPLHNKGPEQFVTMASFQESAWCEEVHGGMVWPPTHWMPLPDPPCAQPPAKDDGWIEWDGKGECPVEKGQQGWVRFADGVCPAAASDISGLRWIHDLQGANIIAYRLAK